MPPKVLLFTFSYRIFSLLNTQGLHALQMLAFRYGQSNSMLFSSAEWCLAVLQLIYRLIITCLIILYFETSALLYSHSLFLNIGSMTRCPCNTVPYTKMQQLAK